MVKVILGGDMMTGRGIDPNLPHAPVPAILELQLTSAIDYVSLA
jgi:hypothetical protein